MKCIVSPAWLGSGLWRLPVMLYRYTTVPNASVLPKPDRFHPSAYQNVLNSAHCPCKSLPWLINKVDDTKETQWWHFHVKMGCLGIIELNIPSYCLNKKKTGFHVTKQFGGHISPTALLMILLWRPCLDTIGVPIRAWGSFCSINTYNIRFRASYSFKLGNCISWFVLFLSFAPVLGFSYTHPLLFISTPIRIR